MKRIKYDHRNIEGQGHWRVEDISDAYFDP
jgi:hypothetical protein